MTAHDVGVEGFVSSTSAVDYPKASSTALAYYKLLQGTAVGVGESSGIDRLTSFRVDEVVQRGYSGPVVEWTWSHLGNSYRQGAEITRLCDALGPHWVRSVGWWVELPEKRGP